MNHQVNFGLYRTFDPKYTHFMASGSGRDTFIAQNNGGLMVADNFPKQVGPKNPWKQSK